VAAVIETFEFKKNTGNIRLCEGSTFRSQWAPYALSSARMVLKRAQPSMDQIKEQYRHIQAGLSDPVEERNLHVPGIENAHTQGHTVSVVASGNVDSIVEHVRMMRARTASSLRWACQ